MSTEHKSNILKTVSSKHIHLQNSKKKNNKNEWKVYYYKEQKSNVYNGRV